MTYRSVLAFSASFVGGVAVLVACGGSTTGGGGNSGVDGGTGGGGGSEGGGGGSTCTTATLPADRACVPGTALAGSPISIGVDATEGCLGCFTTFEPCKVDVSGQDITVSLATKTCPPPGDQACPAICALPGTTCTLPALAAGTYTLKVTGDGARTGFPPRQLVVTSDSSASSSCKLPQPPNDPAPLDGTKYSKACTGDGDCTTATVGSVCSPCKCPNAAIASSELAKYDADFRAASSQCRTPQGDIACAACAPATVACLSGTCTLQ